nr:unnamed protein product [Digitaria exilis]
MMHQYQFEGDQAAITVSVAIARGAHHGAFVDTSFVEPRRERYSALAAGDGVPHEGLEPRAVDEEGEAVAASEEAQVVSAVAPRKGEARGGDAVGPAQRGHELDVAVLVGEEAEEGRRPVVGAEAAEEDGVGEEAAPAPADEGGAGERGGEWREAEKDLPVEVVVALAPAPAPARWYPRSYGRLLCGA